MSQDRRRPLRPDSIVEPIEKLMLRLVERAVEDPAYEESARLAAEVMRLMRDEGLDCSMLVEAEEDTPRTLH